MMFNLMLEWSAKLTLLVVTKKSHANIFKEHILKH